MGEKNLLQLCIFSLKSIAIWGSLAEILARLIYFCGSFNTIEWDKQPCILEIWSKVIFNDHNPFPYCNLFKFFWGLHNIGHRKTMYFLLQPGNQRLIIVISLVVDNIGENIEDEYITLKETPWNNKIPH